MNGINLKYILNVFIIVVIIFGLILFLNSIGINLNIKEPPKKLLQVVTIEGLDNGGDLTPELASSFCDAGKESEGSMNDMCNQLTEKNCNSTTCCGWLNNEICVAGGKDGPTFNTDKNGKTIENNMYYYQNKCHGKGC